MGRKISKVKVLTVMAVIIILFSFFMFLNAGIGTGAYAEEETPVPTAEPTATPAPTATPTPTSAAPAATSTPLPPALTSATYNAGTGALVLTGTNFATVTGTSNDIDPTKVRFTNGKTHVVTLSNTKKVEKTDGMTATIIVADKDKALLASWVDKADVKDLAGNVYSISVLAGWNGPNSKTNVSAHAVTVSGIATIETATYDVSTKKLVITGTNLVTVTSRTTSDIFPAYLTIFDGAANSYTLTTKGVIKIDSATQATITLSDTDAAALATWINKTGTTTVANNTYTIGAEAGWNGYGSGSDLSDNVITVSNYAAPNPTVADNATVVVGGTTSATTTDKVGSIYLVPATFDPTSKTVADLDALVTAKTALKVSVTSTAKAPSIATKGLILGSDSVAYKAVAVDTAGTLSSLSAKSITITNVAAAALTVSATKTGATADGATRLTVTPASGDTISYKVSSTPIGTTNTPKVGLTPSGLTAYTLASDITTANATTNKYLDVYELDNAGKVVKFKELTLTATSFKPDSTAPTYSSVAIDSTKKIVTITLSETIVKATTTDVLLKAAVKIATDGTTFAALGATDTVAISDKTVIVTFTTALTTATNKIQIDANALKDAAGNKTSAITTGAIAAN